MNESKISFSDIKKTFGIPKGGDIRDVNGQVYVYFYGKNSQAKKWADEIKSKYPNGIVFTDTSKMRESVKKKMNEELKYTDVKVGDVLYYWMWGTKNLGGNKQVRKYYKVKILEPISDEKGWERWRAKSLDGPQKGKEVVVHLDTLSKKIGESVNEAIKKLKKPLELGQGKKGVYYLHGVGHDTNGNWSYIVSRGANKGKKIQHQGQWREKLTTNHSDEDVFNSDTAQEIINYYEKFVKESVNEYARIELPTIKINKNNKSVMYYTTEMDVLPKKLLLKWKEKLGGDYLLQTNAGVELHSKEMQGNKWNGITIEKVPFDKMKKLVGESINEGAMKELQMMAKEASTFRQFTKDVWKEFDHLPQNKESVKWLEKVWQDVHSNESLNEAPLGMDMGARKKVYDKLNKGDKVRIIYGTSVSGGNENVFVVTKGKTTVGKQRVERITLINTKNPSGVKYYLYNRDGNIGMAVGDMGAVIKKMEPVNESINEAKVKINKRDNIVIYYTDDMDVITKKELLKWKQELGGNYLLQTNAGVELHSKELEKSGKFDSWNGIRIQRMPYSIIRKQVGESINEGLRKDWAEYIEDTVNSFNNAAFNKFDNKSNNDFIKFDFDGTKFAADGVRRELEKQFPDARVVFGRKGDNYGVSIDVNFRKKHPEFKNEAAHGYADSTAGYVSKHNNEYQMAEKINKSVKGDEMKFYDELEKLHEKLKHAKYMIWLANALRGYKVDMYKDPKIKNKAEAEEALYLLSK